MLKLRRAARALAPALLLAACAAPPQRGDIAPEAASGWSAKPGWHATRQMVVAAHPLAADAGLGMLRAGGSALDAAIAAQLVLGVVEPQSSGIGGGALLMHWDGRAVRAWDGRETAPAAAHERHFVGADGKPAAYADAVFGGRAVGVPGALRMLEDAHRRHGVLPWARLFEPAIRAAAEGFPMGARLHGQLAGDPLLRRDAAARAFFYRDDGTPHPVGHRVRNPALAAVLRSLAQGGSAALHEGQIAADLVARVRGHAMPGPMTAADLAGYRALEREPMCQRWRRWRVCGFPPPSSGHIALMQILGTLDALPKPPQAFDADGLHAFVEASRLAFADRALHVADPAFVPPPAGGWVALLAPDYLAKRAARIGPQRMPQAPAGEGVVTALAPMPAQPEHGTSHIGTVDAQGRAVALTTTIEAQFGARILADGGSGLPGGYLLNNQMTDFALAPADAQGRPVANRVQGGKRPRSSMSPTLVFDAASGELVATLGSPGGAAIIHYTAKAMLGMFGAGLDAQRAIDLPNVAHAGTGAGPVLLERGRFDAATIAALRERGHTVQEAELTSGLHVIQRTPRGWHGGADARREGAAAGD